MLSAVVVIACVTVVESGLADGVSGASAVVVVEIPLTGNN